MRSILNSVTPKEEKTFGTQGTVAAQACNKQLDTLSQQTVHIDGFPGHVRIDLL